MRRILSPQVAIAIAFFLRGFIQGSWYPRIPGVVSDVDVNPAQLGVIFFIYALGNIIAFTIAARFIARIGSSHTHQLFALPFALIVVGLSVTSGTVAFAVGMFVFGLFTGGYDLSTSVQGAVVERRTNTPLISALYGFFSVGALSGSLLSGLLAQAGVQISRQFLVLGIITIPITILITQAMMTDDIVPASQTGNPRKLLSLPPKVLWPLGFTIICIALGEETINNWVALYLREGLETSPAVGSAAYTTFAVATAIGRLTGDKVIARLGVDRTLISGSLLAALGVGTGMIINQPWVIIAGYTLMGLGLAVVVPVTYRRANQIPGIAPARAVATVASIGFTGFLLGPLLIGAIADVASLRVAILAVAVVILGIAALAKANPSPVVLPERSRVVSIPSTKGDPS